jgi:hypothetical protein
MKSCLLSACFMLVFTLVGVGQNSTAPIQSDSTLAGQRTTMKSPDSAIDISRTRGSIGGPTLWSDVSWEIFLIAPPQPIRTTDPFSLIPKSLKSVTLFDARG